MENPECAMDCGKEMRIGMNNGTEPNQLITDLAFQKNVSLTLTCDYSLSTKNL